MKDTNILFFISALKKDQTLHWNLKTHSDGNKVLGVFKVFLWRFSGDGDPILVKNKLKIRFF